MITEDYVSFETAKLLKEKGFNDVPVYTYYLSYGGFYMSSMAVTNKKLYAQGHIAAPTLQMAMKWLREIHHIAIETEWEHLWYAYIKPMTSKPSEEDYYQCESSKYEEACEAAIKYCLENLI